MNLSTLKTHLVVGAVLALSSLAGCGSGDSLGGADTGSVGEDSTGADGVTGDGQTVDDVPGDDVDPTVPDADEPDATEPDVLGDTTTEPSDVTIEADATNDDIEDPGPDAELIDVVESDTADDTITAQPDAIGVDIGPPDVVDVDVAEADAVQADTIEADVPEPDVAEADVMEADVAEADTTETDVAIGDTIEADTTDGDVVDICIDFEALPFRCDDGALVYACSCSDNEISCVDDPASLCPPTAGSCDDGSTLICRIPIPTCGRGTIVAIIDGCYLCVEPDTCEVPLPACESQRGASCTRAGGRGCAPGLHPNTQYACSTPGSVCCSPVRDTSCDDGTEPLCDRLVRECTGTEIRAVQGSCEICVNPATCAPWGQPTCRTDQDCANDEWCNECGSSSCPACEDCVAVCEPAPCESDSALRCRCLRPDCPDGAVSVVRDGCWVCVDAFACTPVRGGCGDL
jgi:hypothetical protein